MALCPTKPTRITVLWSVLLWFYQENLGPYPSEESWCSTTLLCDGGKPISFSAAMAMVFCELLAETTRSCDSFLRLVGKHRTNRGLNPELLVFSCVFCWLKWSKKGALSLSLYDSFGAWLCGRFMDSRSPRKKRSTQGEAWARLGDFL